MDLTLFPSMRAGIVAGLLWLAAPGVRGEEPSSHPVFPATATESLMAKDGQIVTVYGETANSGKSKSGTNFVNFKGAEFYLIAFASDQEPFGENPPAEVYDGKRIVVTGALSIYQGKPQIKLTGPEQVRILGEGEAFPAVPPAPASPSEESGTDAGDRKSETEKPAEPEKPAPKPPVDSKLYFR